MTARTWVVVVETCRAGKVESSTTVGPYHSREKADTDRARWDGGTLNHERVAFVEPVIRPEDFGNPPKPEGRRNRPSPSSRSNHSTAPSLDRDQLVKELFPHG